MKFQLWICTLAVLNLLAVNEAAAQTKLDPTSAKIVALENKLNDAYKRGDAATMESLLADDFIITVEDGSTYSKSGYLAHTADAELHVQISEMIDLKVRMQGNVAIVTGAYHEKGTSKGRAYESRDRLTDVWFKTGNAWQVIAAHYSIPAKQ
jgi:ketosteroid isomerase-like protein